MDENFGAKFSYNFTKCIIFYSVRMHSILKHELAKFSCQFTEITRSSVERKIGGELAENAPKVVEQTTKTN